MPLKRSRKVSRKASRSTKKVSRKVVKPKTSKKSSRKASRKSKKTIKKVSRKTIHKSKKTSKKSSRKASRKSKKTSKKSSRKASRKSKKTNKKVSRKTSPKASGPKDNVSSSKEHKMVFTVASIVPDNIKSNWVDPSDVKIVSNVSSLPNAVKTKFNSYFRKFIPREFDGLTTELFNQLSVKDIKYGTKHIEVFLNTKKHLSSQELRTLKSDVEVYNDKSLSQSDDAEIKVGSIKYYLKSVKFM